VCHHRHGRGTSRVGGRSRGRPCVVRVCVECFDCRQQRVEHRLVASRSFATVTDAVDTGVQSRRPPGMVDGAVVRQRCGQTQQQRPIEWAGRAPDLADQRHRRLLGVVAGVGEVSCVEFGDRLHTANHVAAVIGVTDLAVQVGQ